MSQPLKPEACPQSQRCCTIENKETREEWFILAHRAKRLSLHSMVQTWLVDYSQVGNIMSLFKSRAVKLAWLLSGDSLPAATTLKAQTSTMTQIRWLTRCPGVQAEQVQMLPHVPPSPLPPQQRQNEEEKEKERVCLTVWPMQSVWVIRAEAHTVSVTSSKNRTRAQNCSAQGRQKGLEREKKNTLPSENVTLVTAISAWIFSRSGYTRKRSTVTVCGT